MSRIQQLDPHVVNRIAAGEVIERPASVVKELLENSVDALATRIVVDIVDGGMQLIRISDDGEGIHPDDLLLAVTSHATSKIRSDADLDHVCSLGFRGEALASIASVSRFHIRTRRQGESTGRELECNGGEITVHRECGCPEGTVMEVHNLFFNTPARRRFLRKASTEFGHISEYFVRIALANPSLHLVLRHNEKLVYELPGSGNQLERIRRFFGGEVADHLIPIQADSELPDGGLIRLRGYVGEPSISKATRKCQYLFLNGRAIHDRSLQHALEEAYRGLLMVGRYPISFLFLEMPPSLADVNVHPTKHEVRFQDSQLLYRLTLHALREKFLQLEFRSALNVPQASSAPAIRLNAAAANPVKSELDLWASSAVTISPPRITPLDPIRDPTDTQPLADRSSSSVRTDPEIPPFRPYPPETASFSFNRTNGHHSESERREVPSGGETPLSPPSAEQPQDVATQVTQTEPADFRALQIHDCYLVVAGNNGLEIIDQHALHERILYEHLRQRILSGSVERQRLLIPDPVECSAREAAVLLEYQDLMREIGFELDDFGGTTILLTSYPTLLPKGNLVRIVKDLAEQLEQTDGRTTRRDLLDRMLHTMSCRAAIKAGQRLTPEEMQELLRQRHLVNDSHHCPHGRPTSMMLTREMLDQQFGRLG
jgi:DNA mismatch repair protein MutL